MLISGAIFFLLSPLSFFVPNFLSNPFNNLAATNILSSFGVIALCAFILGCIFLALDGYVVGNNGFNKRVKHLIKKTPIAEKKEENPKDPAFYGWIKSNDIINQYHDFLFFKDSVIKGLFLGFEVSFFINLFFLALLYWLPSLTFETIFKIIITLVLGFLVFLYDKLIWKSSLKEALSDLYSIYRSERIPIA